MATTYNNLFLDTRARLRKAGIEAGQLEARELICYAADKSREQFYRDMALYASDPVEEKLAELLAEQVRHVTAERIFDAMQTASLDTVYFLKGKETAE